MRFVSLFAGIGGFDLGLERAGWECVAQVECEPFALEVLAKHWPDTPRFTDVRTLDAADLPVADAIVGGFPCQPHSVAGKGEGADDPRNLWPDYRRLVADIRPRWVVGENVPGLDRTMLADVVRDLEVLGYEVGVLGVAASTLGATHRRERRFIVARLADSLRARGAARLSGSDPWKEGDSGVALDCGAVEALAHRDRRGCEVERISQPAGIGSASGDVVDGCGAAGSGEAVGDPEDGGLRRGLAQGLAGQPPFADEAVGDACGLYAERLGSPRALESACGTPESEARERGRRGDAACGAGEGMGDAARIGGGAGLRDSEPRGLGRDEFADAGSGPVAYSDSRRSEEPKVLGADIPTEPDWRGPTRPGLGDSTHGISGGMVGPGPGGAWPNPPGPQADWEAPRVAVGIPNRAAKLKALGNAIVPQCAELVGLAINAMDARP